MCRMTPTRMRCIGTGEGFGAPQLGFSVCTKQFCPLPRNCLRSKLESRESSPLAMLGRSDRNCVDRKMSGERRSAVLAKALEAFRMPRRKVAPTTTFVLYRALARLG
jgi:hypothetical protein